MKEKSKMFREILPESNIIDVSKYDDTFLIKSFQKRITETHCSSNEEYFTFLEQNKSEGDVLLDSLNMTTPITLKPVTSSLKQITMNRA